MMWFKIGLAAANCVWGCPEDVEKCSYMGVVTVILRSVDLSRCPVTQSYAGLITFYYYYYYYYYFVTVQLRKAG